MKRTALSKADLLPGVITVLRGVDEITMIQEQGWGGNGQDIELRFEEVEHFPVDFRKQQTYPSRSIKVND